MRRYPENVETVMKLNSLYQLKDGLAVSDRLSTRMVNCSSVLDESGFIGWDMYVPAKGLVQMFLYGSSGISSKDLEWMAERMAKTTSIKNINSEKEYAHLPLLYELYLPVDEKVSSKIGFGSDKSEESYRGDLLWPCHYSMQFGELIRAFRDKEAIMRIVMGKANPEKVEKCKKTFLSCWKTSEIDPDEYFGQPIRIGILLRLSCAPSIRILSVIEQAIPGIKIKLLGEIKEKDVLDIWNSPRDICRTMPDYASRILCMEPVTCEPVIGIELCEEEVKPIPASHCNPKDKKSVCIGQAVTTSGKRQKIKVGELDLRRHFQIIGQTGTGKSTMLATLICDAIEKGYGLTFFDPHGTTIDTILQAVPEKHIKRIRVVRAGDADNPVPLNIWDTSDVLKEERNISDLCELISDIFDPDKEGFVGPRYERWLSTFAKASIALLGHRASLESISILSQSRENMLKLGKAIYKQHPELAEIIKQEYGMDKGPDFHNILNWYLCKFQRLTSVEQLRKTLGAGTNALNFNHTIDTDTVTLIDLASPALGTHASRILGTLTLMKLWNAAMGRRERSRTHIVVVDEASLFQTNPMPRMLAEGRKFGLSMILCHQNLSQLTSDIREALESNAAGFSAFRLSPRDAVNASIRFDDPVMQTKLARLNAFHAVSTISVNGIQTPPFTLDISPVKQQKYGKTIAALIEKNSIETLVEPYRDMRALRYEEIQKILDQGGIQKSTDSYDYFDDPERPIDIPLWLTEWRKKYGEMKNAG